MAIRYVAEMQALQCDRCEHWFEVSRQAIRDPDKLVDLIHRAKEKHKDCKPKRV